MPTICSDGSGGLQWQGSSGQQTANVLLMCLQWAWTGMGINRGVGTKEAARGHVRR
jgi:hypothetical protein